MSIEVDCGKQESCPGCPFESYELNIAQELGKVAACFEGSMPTYTQIARVAELTGTQLGDMDSSKIRHAAANMGAGYCRVIEI